MGAGEGKMRKIREKIQIYLILAFIMGPPFFSSPGYSKVYYTSDTLINESNQLDGKIIHYQGEVVGDILRRGDFCWINVYDGKQAIGIYCEKKMVSSEVEIF